MKGNISLLIVLLTICVGVNANNFDIDAFIDYINSEGINEEIQSIVNRDGNRNYAINFCLLRVHNHSEFCEKYITTYVPVVVTDGGDKYISSEKDNSYTNSDTNSDTDSDTNSDSNSDTNSDTNSEEKLREIFFDPNFDSNSRKKMTEREKNIMISKILKNNKT